MSLRFLTAGESHGPALVVILEGLPAGLPLDAAQINQDLKRRQAGVGAGPRMKIERDQAQILAGVMEGQTTGAPLALLIPNQDHFKWLGKAVEPFTIPRPGHADLGGAVKYGYDDLRPALERASARETAARTAAGAVCKQLLMKFGIQVGGYVVAIGGITADLAGIPLLERPARAERSEVRCPDPLGSEQMAARIRGVMQEKDTLGGVIEVLAWGVPPGLGSFAQWDRRLDARLGAALLSVPAVKGVEIGPAFENAALPGTQAQDGIFLEGNELVRRSLRSGGLEGGVTTGQTLWLRAALKPIATTLTPQPSVDLAKGQEVFTQYERSDFCPVPRAVPILEAMVAFVLAEALLEKLGGDSLQEMLPRFSALRGARLDDLEMSGQAHLFWPEA
jgi:chorismate synthase